MNFKNNNSRKDKFSNTDKPQFNRNDKGDRKPFNKFKEEKPKTIFDRAFIDPDKEKKKKELDALRPATEQVFSKSIDDVENPKYSSNFGNQKNGFTKKQASKYNDERKPFNKDKNGDKPYRSNSFKDHSENGERKFNKYGDKDAKSFENKRTGKYEQRDKKPYERNDKKPYDKKNKFGDKFAQGDTEQPRYKKDNSKYTNNEKPFRNSDKVRSFKEKGFNKEKKEADHPFKKFDHKSEDFKNRFTPFREQHKAYASDRDNNRKKFERQDRHLEKNIAADYNPEAKMPLNKYVSRSGVCSRRDAVEYIKNGDITVNNETILEPGYKVQERDVVKYKNKVIKPERDYVYLLLNKPKGYITTLDDPKGRRTIADLYTHEIKERIFPVGRLDRHTTGLLLLTNDGDLAQQLAHPKYEIKKVYQVKLDKPVAESDIEKIKNGLELEDGITQVDHIAYLEAADEIGIEIHSGKNRIVRRIFEHLNYEVVKLDRVYYAGLTKKNLPKGEYRKLTRQEVINLKYLGKKKKNIEQ